MATSMSDDTQITHKMRVARLHGSRDLRLEEVPEPAPGPGQVKLRNAFTGICGTDLHVYYASNEVLEAMAFTKPHPLTGGMLPQILGHEFSGTVVSLGEDVEGITVGDQVAVYPLYFCGTCSACTSGRPNSCRFVAFHGLNSHGGGMAEYTTVPADKLHRLPPSLDLRMGALVEPMAVAWRAVKLSSVKPGQSALVAGAGPIGLGIWFALRARGIDRVLVSEPSASRRATADALGARTVDPAAANLNTAVAELTDGVGVDVAFDAAGVGAAVNGAIWSLKPGGRLVIVALYEHGFDFNPMPLVMGEKSVVGSLAYLPEDFDEVIAAMVARAYNTTGWVEVISLDDVVLALEELRAGRGMKYLVQPKQSHAGQ